MPSPRPTSPLSHGYQPSAHFDSLQTSPQQQQQQQQQRSAMHSHKASNHQRRPQGSSLRLPSLPRFHPANFPSAQSSVQSTPDGAPLQLPVSPRAHQRMYSDAQKQLYFYQREMLTAAVRGTSPSQAGRPLSPRLQPLGSPGPVTPLALENDEGYLLAGACSGAAAGSRTAEELVERLISEELRERFREESRHQQRPSSAHRSSTSR